MYTNINDVINNCEIVQRFDVDNKILFFRDKNFYYYLVVNNVLINLKENKMKLEIPEFETQKEIKECRGCMFEKYLEGRGECTIADLVEDSTKINCVRDEIIFVKKEIWVECTKENTKVGDKVRAGLGDFRIVKYIIEKNNVNGYDCVVSYNSTCDEFPSFLNKYDIDTNK